MLGFDEININVLHKEATLITKKHNFRKATLKQYKVRMLGLNAWLIWEIQQRKLFIEDEVQKTSLNILQGPKDKVQHVEAPWVVVNECATKRLKQVLDEATWCVADERNQLYVLPSPEELLELDLFPEGVKVKSTIFIEYIIGYQ